MLMTEETVNFDDSQLEHRKNSIFLHHILDELLKLGGGRGGVLKRNMVLKWIPVGFSLFGISVEINDTEFDLIFLEFSDRTNIFAI